MSERTPNTATVRTAWVKGHPFPLTTDLEERDAEFWRWLATHDRETAARAWEEGYRTCDRAWEETADLTTPDEDRADPRNPYREGDPT